MTLSRDTDFTPSKTPVPGARRQPATLEESLRHYKDLINAVGCIVWEGDPQSYAFTFVSEQAERILGYPAARWLDEPTFWVDHIHPEDRERVMAFCVGETRAGRCHEFEYRMIASDGREVWLKDVVTVITEGGRAIWSQGIMIDISDRKRLELALQAQNEHLRQLDTLKSALLDTTAHELRTPLTSIKGYTEFLEDELEGPLTAGQREQVAHIQTGIDRLQGIVDKLIDMARWEAGGLRLDKHDVELGPLIRHVVESLAPQAEAAGLAVAAEVPDSGLVLPMDAMRVEQVLTNLIGNAIKFTPPGGRIRVALTPDAGGARVTVADTGIGVDREHHERIFEKFYQVDGSATREHGGAGLGLTVARALVAAHGGRVGVEDGDGGGAVFWFWLPGA
ncbi:Alkaline phosphatase synthesis sensor protein PhoR [compost metagenome]